MDHVKITELSKQIARLRSEGLSYNAISSELGCSKSTISYYLGTGQKDKTASRRKALRSSHPYVGKCDQFQNSRKTFANKPIRSTFYDVFRAKINGFTEGSDVRFTARDVIDKFGDNPVCYLTGRPIDLDATSSYHFDHIVPVSKGGGNGLDNLGLLCKEANIAKSNLSVQELLDLCKEILDHHDSDS